ncbi:MULTISPECIES: serine hydrolase domain-containing protein [Cyanophyceae]|uniref:serine hydrolase domain-containing protein n=1 Tax=Cyanophyceae TaxID=3028117 RepID=UPI001686F69F|nr:MULTISPECIES: serine hydrolase domain-containing protein [unclassified Phormidium]MBD1915635.1 beta-lactamase family protein [Phormidium sp. FACHB-77]MBD2031945.1 beta-lactamase family protein [Phormidium sp. FACHB-322]MBD2050695.1 beta-lactamase family protein [Leptolyngbya sp. FACHB-60]
MEQGTQAALKEAVDRTLTQAQIPGAAIAVCIEGKPLLTLGMGHQDLHQTISLPSDASFYIYSVTKSLIAATVMKQAKAGRLSLDAPIQDYWSNFPVQTPITLRQILSHSSGLPDYGGLPAYHEAVKVTPGAPWPPEAFFEVASRQGLLFAPGQGWSYSNIGYLVLKLLLEKVTGQSMQAYLDELFFTPLGLTQTFVAASLDDVTGLTPGYTSVFGDELEDMSQRYHPGWVSHGVVVSTAAELATMMHALITGELLALTLVEQMAQPVHRLGPHPPLQNVGCGLGLFVDTASPYARVAGHNGGGPGYSIAAFHFSALAGRPTTIAAATNREGDNVGVDVAYALARVLAEA